MWKQHLETEILHRCNAFLLAEPHTSDVYHFLDTLQSFLTLTIELDLNPKLHQRILSCYEQIHRLIEIQDMAKHDFQKIGDLISAWDKRYSDALKTNKLIHGLKQQITTLEQVIKKNAQEITVTKKYNLHKIN